jgi:hypothetical protein
METELLYSFVQFVASLIGLAIRFYCLYFVGKKLIDYFKRGH